MTTQKIEVLSCNLGGPYTIRIDGQEITDVESYELWQDGPSDVHHVTFTVLTNNFQLRKDKEAPHHSLGWKIAQ